MGLFGQQSVHVISVCRILTKLFNTFMNYWVETQNNFFFSGVHVVFFISLFNPLTAYKSLGMSLIKKKVNCPQLAIMCVTDRRILMGISITCKCNHWVELSSQTIPAVDHFYILIKMIIYIEFCHNIAYFRI